MTAKAMSGKRAAKAAAVPVETVAEVAPTPAPIKITAYKGFNHLLQCCPDGTPFQFEIGKSYEVDGKISACRNGFHACEHLVLVFGYYPPVSNMEINRFCEVTLEGDMDRDGDKTAARKITIIRELTIKEMTERAVALTIEHAKKEDDATGDYGAASSTGDYGAASSTGTRGAASSTGDYGAASALGKYSAAFATGLYGQVSGNEGASLHLDERIDNFGADDHGKIIHVWAGIVGQDGIKPNVFYTLKDGRPVEVTK